MVRKLMMPAISALFLLGALVVRPALAPAAGSLLFNGGMESETPEALPAGWEAVNIGTPAKIAVDPQERHGGATSGRIDAAEVTRSYFRMIKPVPVAPGEEFSVSAWVKVRDIPSGQGNVILIAEFSDGKGITLPMHKVAIADSSAEPWQRVAGSVIAPDRAKRGRFRRRQAHNARGPRVPWRRRRAPRCAEVPSRA